MLKNDMTYAYGYIRVSTDEQKKKGFSVIEQKDELTRYSKINNIEIINFFVDDGYSAGNVNRPDFQKMLSNLSTNNKVKLILTRDSSRLIRNITLKRSLARLFDKLDVVVCYLQTNVDETTIEGSLQADFTALLDETELKRVSPRTIKGMRGSALIGNYSLGGRIVPQGYKRVKNEKSNKGSKLVVDEEKAEVIKEIFDAIATNRMNGEQMLKYLNKNKVFGLKWYRGSLDNIIDNHIYYGRFVTKWFDSDDPSIGQEYRQFWYNETCHTEPIVSRELWEKAFNAYHHYKKQSKHDYIFSRLVYCADTKNVMSNECAYKKTKNGQHLYKYYKETEFKKRVNETKIVNKFVQEYNVYQMTDYNKKIYCNLQSVLMKKERRREILEEDFDNDYIDEDEYRNQIKKINIEILQTKKKIDNLEIDATNEDFRNLPFDRQRAIVLTYIKRIDISFKDDSITIIYNDEVSKKID